MKITEIDVQALSIPVKNPTRISTRTLDKRDYVLVRIRDESDELTGVGYTYVGTRGGRVVAAAVEDLLKPVLLGADADDRIGAWDRMYQETLLTGRRGAIVRAISAVDIALWDLAAKHAGAPLAALLGGGRTPVPAYASGGYYRPGDGDWADAVRREIELNLEDGFTDHKIKVGGLAVAEDAARVAAAADLIGERGRLALDANNAYRNAREALRALAAFEEAAGETQLWWFEEPLSPEDVAGHAWIREHARTPVATGEIAATRWDFQGLMSAGAADVLQPDAGVLGGITEYLRVAHAAATFGLPVAPHWHANLHVHLAAATPNTLAVEHFRLDKDIYNFETIVASEARLRVSDGHLLFSEMPGLGIEFDESAVRKYAVWTT